ILSAIKQTGEFFGTSHIIDLVRGSETAKIKEKGHSSLESFGKGAQYSKSFFQGLIRQLISSGILRVNLERFGAVQLMQNADKIVEGREQFFARAHVERSSTKTISPNTGRVIEEGPQAILFQSLKALRLEIARVKGVPAYVVFSDRTLQDMSVKIPKTKSDFLLVTGVGNKKMNEYYESFSELLKLF
ncbi:MAG: RQC domain-containing protein, partial [Paracoccaceae bacterium]|nr:RQC domain-containing protein [Paracoccaceae bacterium]